MNDQILQLSNELTQSTSDYALANQKFGELQGAYQEAERVADEAKSQLQRQLLEHEQFRLTFVLSWTRINLDFCRNEVTQTSGSNSSQLNQTQAQLAALQLSYDKAASDLVATRNERDATVSDMRQEIERLNLLHGDQRWVKICLVQVE